MYCEYGEYNVFIYFLVTTDEDVHKLHHVENIETCLASSVVVLSSPLARYLLSLKANTISISDPGGICVNVLLAPASTSTYYVQVCTQRESSS